jgi:arabinofuranosyltransferase
MHARMILPALLLLLLPVLVVPATRFTGVTSALLLVWLCAAVSPLRTPFDVRSTPGSFNVRSSDVESLGDHNPVRTATWVNNWPALPEGRDMLAQAVRAPRPTLLYFDAERRLHATPMPADSPYHVVIVGRHLGVTGAAAPLDAYVNDAWGLASPVGAHLALERWSWPGHEKFLRNHWVFAEWAAEHPPQRDLLRAQASREAVEAARAALGCGGLAELKESVRAPLTAERFWRNLTGSYERTQFRFARWPGTAETALCDGR